MLKFLDASGKVNWVSKVRQTLYMNGFGFVWNQQGVGNETLFINEFTQRLKDQYLQVWADTCSNSSKLSTYISFKTNFELEPYFNYLNIRKFRYYYSSFRCSSHQLMIEKGRYLGLDRSQRLCPICKSGIEDEFHFMLICPLYKSLREKYIPERYYIYPTFQQFKLLMANRSENVVKQLAAFIYHSFILRKGELQI